MALSDPNSRRLRGLIGIAVREGRIEEELQLRRELSLCNLERAFERELGDEPLSAVELLRLKVALESHGPQRVSV